MVRWFWLGGLVWGWFRGPGLACGGFRVDLGVWVDSGLGLGLRRGCRVVWFRVGCCERCGGVGSRGERGSPGPKLQGSHGTGQHPQHCQHHPHEADGGPYHWGGGTWPRDWYIHVEMCISLLASHFGHPFLSWVQKVDLCFCVFVWGGGGAEGWVLLAEFGRLFLDFSKLHSCWQSVSILLFWFCPFSKGGYKRPSCSLPYQGL